MFDGQHAAIVSEALWQEVQERLSDNCQGQRLRSNSAQASLLAGLVFDEHGVRMMASHAQKGSRRYRYYVSDQADGALRLPAVELEGAVWGGFQRFFTDEASLLAAMPSADAQSIRAAFDWAKKFSSDDRTIASLQQVLLRVDVLPSELALVIQLPGHGSPATITVPMERKRCGMAVRLIVREKAARELDQKLVALVLRARSWLDRLKSGEVDSIETLAQGEEVTGSFVTRVLYVAFLAPDIVQRIATGNHSPELNADRLMRIGPLPLSWPEQRIVLGLAS